MTDLTDDETTVLLIAAKGEPMIPIGRWALPTKSLIDRGYLKPHGHPGDPTGHFNNMITAAGRQAAEALDTVYEQQLGQIITGVKSINHEQAKCRAHAEQIAVQLVDLAELSRQITGGEKIQELENWSRVILTRALEILK